MSIYPYFIGRGTSREDPIQLPESHRDELKDAKHYLTPPDLVVAVNVALTLGMPLLITGEAGSGKSSIAARLLYELKLGSEVLSYTVKSDTQARDLFYQFDTLGRFHAANTLNPDSDAVDARRFIRFKALGLALLHAIGPDKVSNLLGPYANHLNISKPTRRVVLIDEIDKAPRDVPNDILTEIEQMRLEVPELAGTRSEDAANAGIPVIQLTKEHAKYRPIVIFTSNSERTLPEPFIRRCAYHHLQLPEYHSNNNQDEELVTIENIVAKRIGNRFTKTGFLKEAVELFEKLRESDSPQINRKPSLAELLDWLECIYQRYRKDNRTPVSLAYIAFNDKAFLHNTINTLLLKDKTDHNNGIELLYKQIGLDDKEIGRNNAH